jgi:hypothetical protein
MATYLLLPSIIVSFFSLRSEIVARTMQVAKKVIVVRLEEIFQKIGLVILLIIQLRKHLKVKVRFRTLLYRHLNQAMV